MTPNPLMMADGHFHEWQEVDPQPDAWKYPDDRWKAITVHVEEVASA